ncbi:MAG: hypothetical protein COB27_002035 [Moritella sp.]|uniref:hypothetical protein n=1 Tax=Moritella sp. TaxID=78556 RepID=UPI0021702384|nr:hypothetical protein [Moritella sp.]MBL1415647.1 hypothetical protein [Moritella sp.]
MEHTVLPYNLPKSPKEQLRYLAKIINIPYSFVASGGQQEVEAMTATIMYRHLNRIQQMEAWTLIRGLDSRPLTGKLVDKVLDTKTNPQWGMWSMTNEELLADKKIHEIINTYASGLGVTASAAGTKSVLQEVWKNKKLSKGGWVTLIIWGAVIFNSSELSKVNTELANRTTLNTSSLY